MGEKMEMMEWENSSINARSLLLASIHPFYHPLGGIFDKIHHTEKKLYILVYTERKKKLSSSTTHSQRHLEGGWNI